MNWPPFFAPSGIKFFATLLFPLKANKISSFTILCTGLMLHLDGSIPGKSLVEILNIFTWTYSHWEHSTTGTWAWLRTKVRGKKRSLSQTINLFESLLWRGTWSRGIEGRQRDSGEKQRWEGNHLGVGNCQQWFKRAGPAICLPTRQKQAHIPWR